jgi:hypothetical protein
MEEDDRSSTLPSTTGRPRRKPERPKSQRSKRIGAIVEARAIVEQAESAPIVVEARAIVGANHR